MKFWLKNGLNLFIFLLTRFVDRTYDPKNLASDFKFKRETASWKPHQTHLFNTIWTV